MGSCQTYKEEIFDLGLIKGVQVIVRGDQSKGVIVIPHQEGTKQIYTVSLDNTPNPNADLIKIYRGIADYPWVYDFQVEAGNEYDINPKNNKYTYNCGDGGFWWFAAPATAVIEITINSMRYYAEEIQVMIGGVLYIAYVSRYENTGLVTVQLGHEAATGTGGGSGGGGGEYVVTLQDVKQYEAALSINISQIVNLQSQLTTLTNGKVDKVTGKSLVLDTLITKLENLQEYYKGYFLTEAALETQYPTGQAGWFATVAATDSIWIWSTGTSEWIDSAVSGSGMDPNVYDPQNIQGDAFALSNHTGQLTTDRITGLDTILAAHQALLDNVPSNTNQTIANAQLFKEVVLLGNYDVELKDLNAFMSYSEPAEITLNFVEEEGAFPQFFVVRTYESGDINLAGDPGNAQTIKFFNNKNKPTTKLPGNGNFEYGIRRKNGTTDSFDIVGDDAPEIDQIGIVEGSEDSFAPATNDRDTDPLEFMYNFAMPANGKLFVVTKGTGGSAAVYFPGVVAGGQAMVERVRVDLVNGNFSRCLQLWELNVGDAPSDGNILVKATENANTVSGNRFIGAFTVKNCAQAHPSLLQFTDPDITNDNTRFNESTSANGSIVILANQPNKHLAISIFTTSGDEPITDDGTLELSETSMNWKMRIHSKEGENVAPTFNINADTAGYFEHLVFAIDQEIS